MKRYTGWLLKQSEKDLGILEDPMQERIRTIQEKTGSDTFRMLAEKAVEDSLVLKKNVTFTVLVDVLVSMAPVNVSRGANYVEKIILLLGPPLSMIRTMLAACLSRSLG